MTIDSDSLKAAVAELLALIQESCRSAEEYLKPEYKRSTRGYAKAGLSVLRLLSVEEELLDSYLAELDQHATALHSARALTPQELQGVADVVWPAEESLADMRRLLDREPRTSSGHMLADVDILVIKALRECGADRLVDPDEWDDLLQEGRIIAFRSDQAWKGDANWASFILKALRWELRDWRRKLRNRHVTGLGNKWLPPWAFLEADQRLLNEDSEQMSTLWDILPDTKQKPVSQQVDDTQQVERLQKELSPEDFKLLDLHIGLTNKGGNTMSAGEIYWRSRTGQFGERLIIGSRATAYRKLKELTEEYLLSEQEVIDYTLAVEVEKQIEYLEQHRVTYRFLPNGKLAVIKGGGNFAKSNTAWHLVQAIDSLSPTQRRVFGLWADGMTPEQIADALALPGTAAVADILDASEEQLKVWFEERGIEWEGLATKPKVKRAVPHTLKQGRDDSHCAGFVSF